MTNKNEKCSYGFPVVPDMHCSGCTDPKSEGTHQGCTIEHGHAGCSLDTPPPAPPGEPKYKILFDYGGYEGMKFYDEKEFDSVDEAVKFAVGLNYSTKFIIVKVFWQPS